MAPSLGYRILGIGLVLVPTMLLSTPSLAQDISGREAIPATTHQAEPTWKGALTDSLRLLMLEHAGRVVFQSKTRSELGGPFVRDYVKSVRWPGTWGDGDDWPVNYVGHPVHGASAGFIWLDHEAGAHDPAMGFSRGYWASRARATAWAAAYSFQFELGPLSEASIGNVGMRPNTTGWVDHVVTPAGALGFIVAEDAVDRYVITAIESWTDNRAVQGFVRTLFNPSRSLSNVVQGRTPWFRARRSLGREPRPNP